MTSSAPRLPPGSPEPENEVRLTFIEHLRELRVRLLHALYGVGAGMAVVAWFVPQIRRFLLAPTLVGLPAAEQRLRHESIEAMMVSFKIVLYGAVFVAAPWVLWQLWLFIAPGLYKREKKVVFPFLFFGTLLFYAGAAFCHLVIIPNAFPAMLAFGADDPMLQAMPSLDKQFSLVLAMLLGFGIVFELPVVIAFLAMIGLVSAPFLAKYRRHAMIANVALAAVITPTGDPLNLALMALPLIVFYEVGILLARILGKKPAQPGTGAS